ncbi:hypothetical protein [Paramicrobacterium humi]|uniref:hypothetical protein n=1 Tax=Paramicrobacterium humi TaxID=640635 RepID=UPI000B8508B2|nr:hypothetical protein [Microbacterium humi]
MLDGTVIGALNKGEHLEEPLEAGSHSLQVRAGRFVSPELAFDIDASETVSYACRGRLVLPLYTSQRAPVAGIDLRSE